jgi:hypothetical protein
VHHHDDALRIHCGHDTQEPGPRDAREGDRAIFPHEEDGLVTVDGLSRLEVEGACDNHVPIRGFRRCEGEARAPEEGRLFERQSNVVERIKKDHPLVGWHSICERVGLVSKRLGCQLVAPRLGDAFVEVPVAEETPVDDSDARDPPGDMPLVLAPELGLVGDHPVSQEAGVLGADRFGRPFQVHLTEARPHPHPTMGGCRRRHIDPRRLDVRGRPYGSVGERQRSAKADSAEHGKPPATPHPKGHDLIALGTAVPTPS